MDNTAMEINYLQYAKFEVCRLCPSQDLQGMRLLDARKSELSTAGWFSTQAIAWQEPATPSLVEAIFDLLLSSSPVVESYSKCQRDEWE